MDLMNYSTLRTLSRVLTCRPSGAAGQRGAGQSTFLAVCCA